MDQTSEIYSKEAVHAVILWDDACLVDSLSTNTHNNAGASILAVGSGEEEHSVFEGTVGKAVDWPSKPWMENHHIMLQSTMFVNIRE